MSNSFSSTDKKLPEDWVPEGYTFQNTKATIKKTVVESNSRETIAYSYEKSANASEIDDENI
jgi:hypothetical protein